MLCIAMIANLLALNTIAKESHTRAYNHATPVGMLKIVHVILAAVMKVVVQSMVDVGDKVDNPVVPSVKVVTPDRAGDDSGNIFFTIRVLDAWNSLPVWLINCGAIVI